MRLLRVVVILAVTVSAGAQQDKTPQKQNEHHQAVNERGDHVMGFSHEKTTHHFLLLKDGGAIEVEANDAQDMASRDQIRMHLGHIVGLFAAGDFNAPLLIHGVNPPGASTMKALREKIEYKYVDTGRGGRVRITTHDGKALKAVHEFLRFQIKDHQTGDTMPVSGDNN
jgi:hypothetical protein